MTEWNLAEVFETVAARLPDAPALAQGDRSQTWSEINRRADGIAARAARRRLRRAGQGRPVPLQLPRVPREHVRRVQGRAGDRSTPTTATPTTSSSTCGTTPTPSPSCSTAPSPSTASGSARRAAARSACGSGSTTAPGRAPIGRRPTRRRGDGGRDDVAGRGAAAATTCTALHRRHDRDAEGRDVASGRPVRALDANNRVPTSRPRARSTPGSSSPGRATCPAAPLMHGTGCFNVISNLMIGGSVTMLVGRRFDPIELLDTIEQRSDQLDVDRRRRLRQADRSRPRRRTRPMGHLQPARRSSRAA